MGKSDFVEKIAQDNRHSGLPKKIVGEIVENTFSFIVKSLKDKKKFTYPGFGSFRLLNRKARTGTNPNTGQTMQIAARKSISFTASNKLKKKLR